MRYMRKPLTTMTLVCLITSSTTSTTSAQSGLGADAMRRYSTLHPRRIPTTYALAYKGQLRLDAGLMRGAHTRIPYTGTGERTDVNPFFEEESRFSASDLHFSISYTPWEHITLDASLHGGTSGSAYISSNSIAAVNYALTATATYHTKFSDHFAYEGGYSLGGGRLSLVGYESTSLIDRILFDYDAKYRQKTDCAYSMVSQNISGGISAFTGEQNKHRFQCTFMLNVGLTHYSGFTDNANFNRWDESVKQQLRSNSNIFSLTPSLIFTLNLPWVLSVHVNISRPTTWIDGSSYAAITAGVQLSLRLRKMRILPQSSNA